MNRFVSHATFLFFYTMPCLLPAQVKDSFILVPGGNYLMGDVFGDGSKDEVPVHQVEVHDFYLSPYELTTGEYLRFAEATKSNYPAWLEAGSAYHFRHGARDYYRASGTALTDPDHPIVGITWKNAVAYCNWLSMQRGLTPVYAVSGDTFVRDTSANGYRLPTEAEWEYAARERGKTCRFGTGKDKAGVADINVDVRAIFERPYMTSGESLLRTLPVRSLKPNALGLYHMSGNVWEWCQDWYAVDYYTKPTRQAGPTGPDTGTHKVLRGGSWYFDGYHARCSNRHHARAEQHFHAAGVRLARNND